MGKNNFLPKCLFLLKNDFKIMLFFIFFSILGKWGGWVLERMENSILFFIEGFPYPPLENLKIVPLHCQIKTLTVCIVYFMQDAGSPTVQYNSTTFVVWVRRLSTGTTSLCLPVGLTAGVKDTCLTCLVLLLHLSVEFVDGVFLMVFHSLSW